MKMNRNSLLVMVTGSILLTGGSLLSGCGNRGSQNPLIGAYKTISLQTADGKQKACPADIILAPTVHLSCGDNDTLTFGTDGKVVFHDSQYSNTTTRTYSVNGNNLTVNVPANSPEAAYSNTYSISISGSQLILKQTSTTSPDPVDGKNYNNTVMVLQKQ